MIYVRNYVIPYYTKGRGGDEDSRIKELYWRYIGFYRDNNEGYKMMCPTLIKRHIHDLYLV